MSSAFFMFKAATSLGFLSLGFVKINLRLHFLLLDSGASLLLGLEHLSRFLKSRQVRVQFLTPKAYKVSSKERQNLLKHLWNARIQLHHDASKLLLSLGNQLC